NLIPPDARRGDQTQLRRGAISYVLFAALGVALLGVIALAFTDKQIDDRKGEVANLQQESAEATARAQSVQAFTAFHAAQVARTDTVKSLAQSRFDWNRVLNELARVIPGDVWLIQMSGTVNPTVQLDNAPDISIRDSVPGPALEIVGCAPSQDAVAGFIADLQNIDGVTRVGVASSEKADPNQIQSQANAAVAGASQQNGQTECRTRSFILKFEIVVAFDKVPTPATASASPSVPAPAAPPTSSSGQQLTGSQTGASSVGSSATAAASNAAGTASGG